MWSAAADDDYCILLVCTFCSTRIVTHVTDALYYCDDEEDAEEEEDEEEEEEGDDDEENEHEGKKEWEDAGKSQDEEEEGTCFCCQESPKSLGLNSIETY